MLTDGITHAPKLWEHNVQIKQLAAITNGTPNLSVVNYYYIQAKVMCLSNKEFMLNRVVEAT